MIYLGKKGIYYYGGLFYTIRKPPLCLRTQASHTCCRTRNNTYAHAELGLETIMLEETVKSQIACHYGSL